MRACLKNSGPAQAKNAPRRAFTAKFARGCGAVLGVAHRKNQSSGDTLGGISHCVFGSRPCLRGQRGSGGRNSSSCSSAPQRATDGGGGGAARATTAFAHTWLATRFGVLDVSHDVSSVASGLSRSFACFAGLHLPARVKQHSDASGVDDGLDDFQRPVAQRAPRKVDREDAGEEPTPGYPFRLKFQTTISSKLPQRARYGAVTARFRDRRPVRCRHVAC